MAKNFYALGRVKKGTLNKLEQRYADYLEQLRIGGEVLWYKFEGIKLRLADSCFYSPDFAVLAKDGVMEMHECKGFMMDDSAVKLKTAAAMYPFRFFLIRQKAKRDGGGWSMQEY